MGSVFGGGGGGGGGPAPDTTTQFIREAPGIEERKLELMDLARQTAQSPISIPDIQVQGLSPLEQAAITQAGQTGVGAGAVGQAITGTQAAMGAPNISQFYNPYQSYVLDEINRQYSLSPPFPLYTYLRVVRKKVFTSLKKIFYGNLQMLIILFYPHIIYLM